MKLKWFIICLVAVMDAANMNEGAELWRCGKTDGINVLKKMRDAMKKHTTTPMVRRGDFAEPNTHPWLVHLEDSMTNYCSGILIAAPGKHDSSDIVLSAAHCLKASMSTRCAITKVVAGSHLIHKVESLEKTVPIKKCHLHENYKVHENSTEHYLVHDIVLLKLRKPVNFSATIRPICLPEKNKLVPEGTLAVVAGWGATNGSVDIGAQALQEAAVPIISFDNCRKVFGDRIDPSSHMCTKNINFTNFCEGDSGGALVVPKEGTDDTEFILHGIISFGATCKRGKSGAGVYTNVAKYIDWIHETVKKLSKE